MCVICDYLFSLVNLTLLHPVLLHLLENVPRSDHEDVKQNALTISTASMITEVIKYTVKLSTYMKIE